VRYGSAFLARLWWPDTLAAMDIAELQENGRAFAERAERNPWVQVWRIVKAEVERSSNDKLVEMYVRLFKAYEASCYQLLSPRWRSSGHCYKQLEQCRSKKVKAAILPAA
jgi:hypothetical protein